MKSVLLTMDAGARRQGVDFREKAVEEVRSDTALPTLVKPATGGQVCADRSLQAASAHSPKASVEAA